jgi:hypothetical protein
MRPAGRKCFATKTLPSRNARTAASWLTPRRSALRDVTCLPARPGELPGVTHIAGYLSAGTVSEVGSLTEGQTVLIHAGAGGVGMAAIQLAQPVSSS